MKNNLKIVCGTLAGYIIGTLTIVGANQAIQAIQNTEIKVDLNGQIQEFKDETTGETQYPIIYNDRTYLPLRNVANLVGLSVDYDNKTKTAILNENSKKLVFTSPYGTGTKKEREYTAYKDNYVVYAIREHFTDGGVQSQLIIENTHSGISPVKHEFSVAMNNETDEFLYEIKDDEIYVTKYIPFPDEDRRPDYAYKLFRVDYKITEHYGTFNEEVISIDLGDNKLAANRTPSESELKSASELLNNNKDKIKDSSEWFITNTVHATVQVVPGPYVGEFYYFGDDGTYYWGASEYYNDQEHVASIGTWSKENDKLILMASHMLYLKDGKLVAQSQPNGLSEKELVDYKETIVWGPSQDIHELKFVGNYDIKELNLTEYEYTMDGKTWFANTNFDMDDNPWIKKIKEYKEKFPFLGNYNYYSESDEENGYEYYLGFSNIQDFWISVTYDKKEFLLIHGTYEVDGNKITCNFNKCTLESVGSDYDIAGSKLILECNDLYDIRVIDWKYNSDAPIQSYGHAFFMNDFVKVGDVFYLITT